MKCCSVLHTLVHTADTLTAHQVSTQFSCVLCNMISILCLTSNILLQGSSSNRILYKVLKAKPAQHITVLRGVSWRSRVLCICVCTCLGAGRLPDSAWLLTTSPGRRQTSRLVFCSVASVDCSDVQIFTRGGAAAVHCGHWPGDADSLCPTASFGFGGQYKLFWDETHLGSK